MGLLNDGEIIHVYKLSMQFTRMRLCVRIIPAAPLGLFCLLVGALKDSRSWLAAVESDILFEEFELRNVAAEIRQCKVNSRADVEND